MKSVCYVSLAMILGPLTSSVGLAKLVEPGGGRNDFHFPERPDPTMLPVIPQDGSHTFCSPRVKKKNVENLEATLDGLLKTKDFSNAQKLKSILQRIRSSPELDQRIKEYLALVGVDFQNATELAEFVGARDLAPYVELARKRVEVSERQASILVEKISTALLSSIN